MNREKESLLHDLLENHAQARRESVLTAGSRLMRRKRRWRAARGCLGAGTLALLLVAAAFALKQKDSSDAAAAALSPSAAPPSPQRVRYLSDAELLDLFPGTPVALGIMDGKKRLIFPRAGDEARFVAHIPD